MTVSKIAGLVIPFVIVLAIVSVFWTIMWKFVLEPNPLIRDFFDLDQGKKKKN